MLNHRYLRNLQSCCQQPLFLAGLLLCLALIVTILPSPVGQWYVPFLGNSLNTFSLDPWQGWLDQGGAPIAFPYGYAMWLFLLPLSLFCKVLSIPMAYGYGLSLIVADMGLLSILRKLFNTKDWVLMAVYWLPPLV